MTVLAWICMSAQCGSLCIRQLAKHIWPARKVTDSKHTVLQAPVTSEALTPFVRLHEPEPLTPVISAAHNSHAKASRVPLLPAASACSPHTLMLLRPCLRVLSPGGCMETHPACCELDGQISHMGVVCERVLCTGNHSFG